MPELRTGDHRAASRRTGGLNRHSLQSSVLGVVIEDFHDPRLLNVRPPGPAKGRHARKLTQGRILRHHVALVNEPPLPSLMTGRTLITLTPREMQQKLRRPVCIVCIHSEVVKSGRDDQSNQLVPR